MTRRVALGAAVPIVFLIAGCSTPQAKPVIASPTTSVQPKMPTVVVQSAGGKKAVVHAGVSSVPEESGQLLGTLAADGAGCVVVRARDGEMTTLIFPQGTTFTAESLALPDGSSLSEGAKVALDGARVPADEKLSMCPNDFRLFSVVTATVTP